MWSRFHSYWRIESNKLTGSVPSELSKMTNMHDHMSLYSNKFLCSVPQSVVNWINARASGYLRVLDCGSSSALTKLYQQSNGHHWANRNFWMAENACTRTWNGVSCRSKLSL